jgi:hypothetical protein
VSPILTRPVREQLEHDRVIRLLQARYKRKHDVVMNPGAEQNQSVTVGELAVFPDLLLYGTEKSRKLQGTVEVETGESVNQLEALAEWRVFTKLNLPLHLYVPPTAVDAARRLCTEHQIPVAEIWTFHMNFDQVRFTMVHRAPDAVIPKVKPEPPIAAPAAVKAKAVVAAPKAKTPPAATSKPAKPKAAVKAQAVAKPKPAKAKAKVVAKAKTATKATAKAAAKPAARPKPAAKKAAKPVRRR